MVIGFGEKETKTTVAYIKKKLTAALVARAPVAHSKYRRLRDQNHGEESCDKQNTFRESNHNRHLADMNNSIFKIPVKAKFLFMRTKSKKRKVF